MAKKSSQLIILALSALLLPPCLAEKPIRIADEGTIRDQWQLADGAQIAAPGYPSEFVSRANSVCVALGYLINPDGNTSDFTLLKQWNGESAEEEPVPGYWDAFGKASAAAVGQWRFKPRPEVASPTPTYTVATLVFNGKHGNPQETRDHCKIPDLRGLILKTQADSARNGINRALMERLRGAAQAGPGYMPSLTPRNGTR